MTKKEKIDNKWSKMSLTKCWKFAKTFYKPKHLKNGLYYWLIESSLDNGDELELGSLLRDLEK